MKTVMMSLFEMGGALWPGGILQVSCVRMIEWLILKFGLILNLVGTLMIAFSIRRNPEDANQNYRGRTIYLASILHPNLFRWGIAILIIGFLLSILDSVILKAIMSPHPQ